MTITRCRSLIKVDDWHEQRFKGAINQRAPRQSEQPAAVGATQQTLACEDNHAIHLTKGVVVVFVLFSSSFFIFKLVAQWFTLLIFLVVVAASTNTSKWNAWPVSASCRRGKVTRGRRRSTAHWAKAHVVFPAGLKCDWLTCLITFAKGSNINPPTVTFRGAEVFRSSPSHGNKFKFNFFFFFYLKEKKEKIWNKHTFMA